MLGRNSGEKNDVSAESPRPLEFQGVFGAILDALVEPVLVVGADGVVELDNAAAIQVLGADRDVGRPLSEHFARVSVRTLTRARWSASGRPTS
jgi:transcriptional regulator of aromatic amino acid metabolism